MSPVELSYRATVKRSAQAEGEASKAQDAEPFSYLAASMSQLPTTIHPIMNSSTEQPSSSGYIEVRQTDSLSPQSRQEDHNSNVPQSAGDAESPSLESQANSDHYQDSTNHLPQTTSEQSHSVSPVSDISSPTHEEARPASMQPKSEWRSWKLSWWFNTALFLTEISFIVAIMVLDRLSAQENGIITVPNVQSSPNTLSLFAIRNIRQYYGLLWTSLPSFIFTLYSLTWATVVTASYERQPFIELRHGGNACRTIMLDYRAYPAFYNWILAFMHKHIHIGCAIFLSIIVSVAVVPLSAHLFVAASSTYRSDIALSFATQYNDSVDVALIDLLPFIDIATAVHAYGSTPPSWMTAEYAFAPFSSSAASNEFSANLTATTDAYSAYLNCQALNIGSYTVSYVDTGIAHGTDYGYATFQFSDHSCAITQSINLANNIQTYARSWYANCPGQAFNRFGMLTATYSSSSSSKLAEISVISCIPSYWHSRGPLTVYFNDASSPASNYINFIERKSTVMRPAFSDYFELILPAYSINNGADNSNMDAMGSSVLATASAAAGRNNRADMAPENILDATERVFTTVYAALVASDVISPAESVTGGNGVLVEPVNRLFVAHPIAYTIVSVLLLVLLSHAALWVYATRYSSILREEPLGLLGYAILLEGSDILEVVNTVKTKYAEKEKVRESLKKKFNIKTCKISWNEHDGKIEVEDLTEKT